MPRTTCHDDSLRRIQMKVLPGNDITGDGDNPERYLVRWCP
jgi:hypothetical protein